MTKAFPTSTLNREPDRDDEVVKRFQRVHYWHLADVIPGKGTSACEGKADITPESCHVG